MRFRKRYLLILIPFILAGVFRLEYFTMRESDEGIAASLAKYGIDDARFLDYRVGEQNMHYVHSGEEGKPLLILVHGTPGASTAFTSYLTDSTLRDAFQMAAVDRPGLGYSDFGTTEPSVALQAAAIKPIIDHHPAEKVVVLGHSYGGPVVARMAMDYPDLIDGLVIVAGSISPELEPNEWWRIPLDWWVVRWILPPSLKVANQEIMALYEELNDMMPLWSKVTSPSIVFQGTLDELVDPGNAAFADSMLVNATLKDIQYIENDGHFILWSKREMISKQIVEKLIPDGSTSTDSLGMVD